LATKVPVNSSCRCRYHPRWQRRSVASETGPPPCACVGSASTARAAAGCEPASRPGHRRHGFAWRSFSSSPVDHSFVAAVPAAASSW